METTSSSCVIKCLCVLVRKRGIDGQGKRESVTLLGEESRKSRARRLRSPLGLQCVF